MSKKAFTEGLNIYSPATTLEMLVLTAVRHGENLRWYLGGSLQVVFGGFGRPDPTGVPPNIVFFPPPKSPAALDSVGFC